MNEIKKRIAEIEEGIMKCQHRIKRYISEKKWHLVDTTVACQNNLQSEKNTLEWALSQLED